MILLVGPEDSEQLLLYRQYSTCVVGSTKVEYKLRFEKKNTVETCWLRVMVLAQVLYCNVQLDR
jgi:hypothetical protein